MTSKKITQSIALIFSTTLVVLFVGYRAGYFDKSNKRNQSQASFSNTKEDSSRSSSKIEIIKPDSLKKDSPIIVSYEPLDKSYLKIDFEEMIKKSKLAKDTVEIELPDSLFLVNEDNLFIKDKLINKTDFENYISDNLRNAYYNQRNVIMSSSKSMAIFSQGEKFINFKNFKFKYNKIIPENYLLSANLFKSNLYKIWPVKKLNQFSIMEKQNNQNFLIDSDKTSIDKMTLSSKYGYVITKKEFKKDTIKNIMGSSKSRIVFSREDAKRETASSSANDSIKNKSQ